MSALPAKRRTQTGELVNSKHQLEFEKQFTRLVLARFDQAEALIPNHKFLSIRRMIRKYGAVVVARRMVDPANLLHLNLGLKVLAKNNLTRCSIEQAVIDVGFGKETPFSRLDVKNAEARLWSVIHDQSEIGV